MLVFFLFFFKNFAVWSFFLACDKNWPFLISYKKYWMSSCTTCLIRNSDIPMSLVIDLIGLLGSLSVIAWISPTNQRVLIRMISDASKLPYLCNHHWTHPILFESSAVSSDWHPNTVKSLYWSSSLNVKQYNIPFLNFWGNELNHDAAFLTNSPQLTLVYCTIDKNLKQRKYMY